MSDRNLPSRLFPLLAMLVAAALLVVPGGTNEADAAETPTPAQAEAQFTALINGLRTSRGLNALTVDGQLVGQARAWSRVMSSDDQLKHAGNLAVGVSADWEVLGENVGTHGIPDVDGLFQAFVNSPGHLSNLVDPRFDRVGVGVVIDEDGTIWTTHRFMAVRGEEPAPTTTTTTAPPTTTTTTRPPTTARPTTTTTTRPPTTARPTTTAQPTTTRAPRPSTTTPPAPTTTVVRPPDRVVPSIVQPTTTPPTTRPPVTTAAPSTTTARPPATDRPAPTTTTPPITTGPVTAFDPPFDLPVPAPVPVPDTGLPTTFPTSPVSPTDGLATPTTNPVGPVADPVDEPPSTTAPIGPARPPTTDVDPELPTEPIQAGPAPDTTVPAPGPTLPPEGPVAPDTPTEPPAPSTTATAPTADRPALPADNPWTFFYRHLLPELWSWFFLIDNSGVENGPEIDQDQVRDLLGLLDTFAD